MAIQDIALGTAPTGAGGDTFRSAAAKINENFSNNAHAASRYVGTSAGNVMEVGAFGLGKPNDISVNVNNSRYFNGKGGVVGFCDASRIIPNLQSGASVVTVAGLSIVGDPWWQGSMNQLIMSWGQIYIRAADNAGGFGKAMRLLSQINTTVDANGFIKAASPIVQLFADRIELNDEAAEQDITLEKVDIGHYLLKNTEGFSDNGWYIEMPKDANGNVLVAVQYQQIEDNTIEVKTFAKKFDEETGDIVPNLEKPRDIPSGRWIDIRLKELPKPEIDIPISTPPAEFQPTNLAQAVAEALKNGSE